MICSIISLRVATCVHLPWRPLLKRLRRNSWLQQKSSLMHLIPYPNTHNNMTQSVSDNLILFYYFYIPGSPRAHTKNCRDSLRSGHKGNWLHLGKFVPSLVGTCSDKVFLHMISAKKICLLVKINWLPVENLHELTYVCMTCDSSTINWLW